MIPTNERKFVTLEIQIDNLIEILSRHGYLYQIGLEHMTHVLPQPARVIDAELKKIIAGDHRLQIHLESDALVDGCKYQGAIRTMSVGIPGSGMKLYAAGHPREEGVGMVIARNRQEAQDISACSQFIQVEMNWPRFFRLDKKYGVEFKRLD